MRFCLSLVLVATRVRVHVCSATDRLAVAVTCYMHVKDYKMEIHLCGEPRCRGEHFAKESRYANLFRNWEKIFPNTTFFAFYFDVSIAVERARDKLNSYLEFDAKIKMKRKAHFAWHHLSYRLFQSTPDCPILPALFDNNSISSLFFVYYFL